MKYKIYFVLFFALLSAAAWAQPTFSLTPNPAQEEAFPDVPDTEAHIVITNLENVDKPIRWTREVVFINNYCYTQVCDPITCYFPTVSTRQFTLHASDPDTLIVHLRNDSAQWCCAVINLRLQNLNNPADTATAHYFFNNCASGTHGALPEATAILYPNPATNYFRLTHAEAATGVHLYTTDGRLVRFYNAAPDSMYDLGGIPAGNYYLLLEEKTGKMFQLLDLRKQ